MSTSNEQTKHNTFYVQDNLKKFCFGFFYIGNQKIFVRKLSKTYSSKLNSEVSGIINIFDINIQIEIASLTRLFMSQNIEVFYDEILAEKLGYDSPYLRPSIWIKEMYVNELQQ